MISYKCLESSNVPKYRESIRLKCEWGDKMDKKSIINENLIKLDLRVNNREEAIKELALLLEKEKRVESANSFIESVQYRESIASTYCGFEIAIPHGISSTVKEASLCFCRVNGFNWTEDEEDHVRFIFLIAIPENKSEEEDTHLEILSSMAKLCLLEDVRNKWETAKTSEDILDSIFNNIE